MLLTDLVCCNNVAGILNGTGSENALPMLLACCHGKAGRCKDHLCPLQCHDTVKLRKTDELRAICCRFIDTLTGILYIRTFVVAGIHLYYRNPVFTQIFHGISPYKKNEK